MPQPVVAQTGEQWMRQTERRLGSLERRPAQVGNRFTNDGVMWSTTVPERVPYIEPTMTGWINYGGGYHNVGYTKTSTGIVAHTGLINRTTGGTAFTLPPEYRPDFKVLTAAIDGGGLGNVLITPAGAVTASVLGTSWSSLAGIMYPAAGVANWTPITTFVNNFASYHAVDPTYPVAAYWMDPFGRVWFRGLIYRTAGGIPATDTIAFTLPTALGPGTQIHLGEISSGGFASYHISPTGAFVVKTGTQGVGWMGLLKCTYFAASVWPRTSIQRLRMAYGDWNNFGGGFPEAGIVVFPDGIAMMDGLVNSGTIGPNGTVAYTPDGMSPDDRLGPRETGADVYLCNAAQTAGRYDITRSQGTQAFGTSVIAPVSGATGYRSMNGVNYLIGS